MTPDGDDQLRTMFRFFLEIGIIAQLSGNAFERAMRDGLTLPQFVVLSHLTRLGGNKTPLDLARAVQVTKGAMTNTLQHLESKALVAITPDDVDRRSKRVDITPAGRAAHNNAVGAIGPELRHLLDQLDIDGITATLPLLERVRKILDDRRN